jgi:hypothetical protein
MGSRIRVAPSSQESGVTRVGTCRGIGASLSGGVSECVNQTRHSVTYFEIQPVSTLFKKTCRLR